MWNPVKHPPKTGGHYAVGGYVNDGVLPRRFEPAFARCVLTLNGPSWSHCDDRKGHVPIEYWQDLGAHPDAAMAKATDADVEKVARALYEEDDPWHQAWPWPDLNPEAQGGAATADTYRRLARVATAAIARATGA